MRLIAEATETAKGFRPLILPHDAPRAMFGTGARRAGAAGAGEDFFQHRDYGFGDNAQNIDWRQSARSDDILVRENERLLPHRVYLFCDNSAAMQFNSRGALPTKSFAAQRLMLALSTLMMQGESQVMPLDAPPQNYPLPALAREISKENEIYFPPRVPLKPNSHLIIASDFRQGAAEWEPVINHFAAARVFGICIQMLDPLENEFPLYGRVRLESAEDESTMVIPSADSVRPVYLERLAREQSAMNNICLTRAWRWASFTSDMPARMQLAEILKILAVR